MLIIGVVYIIVDLVCLVFIYDFEIIVIDLCGVFFEKIQFLYFLDQIFLVYLVEVLLNFILDVYIYVVVFLYDFKIDDNVLYFFLLLEVVYIGVLGSCKMYVK